MDDISNILATGILYGKIFFLPILFIGLIIHFIIKKIDENEKFFKAFFLTGIITTIFSGIAALIIFIIAPYAIIFKECRKIRRNPIVQISTFFFKGIILINTLIQESPPGPTTKQLKQLNELKMAHDNGYISDIDYEQRVQSIRDQIR
jgi:hypothetical protein